jgi:glycosyltransferase involved in cell wall biosynthesis
MKPRVRVSIVIPAYNEESYLPACLDAIAAQTVRPFEVIVVDNNSTDRTAQVAARYPFVRILPQPRQGRVFAVTAGLDAAIGDIIGRIDADTQLAPDWIALVATYFAEHPGVVAVTGKCYFGDMPLKRTLSAVHAFFYHYIHKWIARGEILWGSNMAIRRRTWQDVRANCANRTDIDEDIDLSIQLAKRGLHVRRLKVAQATVSLRRGNLAPRPLFMYLQSWHRNYFVNGQNGRGAAVYALMIMSYLVALPFVLIYQLLHRR